MLYASYILLHRRCLPAALLGGSGRPFEACEKDFRAVARIAQRRHEMSKVSSTKIATPKNREREVFVCDDFCIWTWKSVEIHGYIMCIYI